MFRMKVAIVKLIGVLRFYDEVIYGHSRQLCDCSRKLVRSDVVQDVHGERHVELLVHEWKCKHVRGSKAEDPWPRACLSCDAQHSVREGATDETDRRVRV